MQRRDKLCEHSSMVYNPNVNNSFSLNTKSLSTYSTSFLSRQVQKLQKSNTLPRWVGFRDKTDSTIFAKAHNTLRNVPTSSKRWSEVLIPILQCMGFCLDFSGVYDKIVR